MNVVRRAAGGAAVLSAAGSLYVGWSWSRDPLASTSHTVQSVAYQLAANRALTSMGGSALAKLEADCTDAAKVNAALLTELLTAGATTAYGQDAGLDPGWSREEYAARHPLTTHGAYSGYVDRVLAGERNVLFSAVPRMIAETSGTSGTKKLLPVAPLQRKVFFMHGITTVFGTLAREVDGFPNLQKTCKLVYTPSYTLTAPRPPARGSDHNPRPLKVGPNSSAPGDNPALLQLYTTPAAAFAEENERELLWLHCLFALKDRHLGVIESNFATNVFNFFVAIDRHWDVLLATIETGELPAALNIDPTVRAQLQEDLKPDPVRAAELRRLASPAAAPAQADLTGGAAAAAPGAGSRARRLPTAAELWPHLKVCMCVATGPTFALPGDRLRALLGRSVPVYSPLYAATEGLIGVNTSIDAASYTLHPRGMFFEFIDEADIDAVAPRTRFIEQIVPGQAYELVITNLTGLYRYRFGDVVRCVGYRGEAPLVEFAYRKGQLLNARGEKYTEEAFDAAMRRWTDSAAGATGGGIELKNYANIEYFDAGDRLPRYTVYVEAAAGSAAPATAAAIAALDAELCAGNDIYALFRQKRMLEPVRVVPVETGTFAAVRDEMVNTLRCSPTQAKIPRVVRDRRLVDVLVAGSCGGGDIGGGAGPAAGARAAAMSWHGLW